MRLAADAGDRPRFEKFAEPFVSFNLGSALFRKSVFDKVGLYDPTLRHGEDTDWFMRAREQGVSMVIPEQVTLLYRIHEHNMTRNKLTRESHFIQALKKSLDRRRQQSGDIAAPLPKLFYLDRSISDWQNPKEC
jgi:GT2 family glycosyltransferase